MEPLGGLGLWAVKQDGAGTGRPSCGVGIFSSGRNGEVGCANDVKYDPRWKMCYRMIQWLYGGCLATTGGSPLYI
jgi:hypothetical protein